MTLPDQNRTRPARGGTGSDDSLAGGVETSLAPNVDTSTQVERAVVGALLADLPPFQVAQHLDGLTTDLFTDAVCMFVFDALEATTAAGHPTNPLLVIENARRAQLEVPPALGIHALSELCRLQAEAPPAACLPHLIDVLRDHAARRSVQALGRRLYEAAWIGDLDRLAEWVQTESSRVLGELAAVVGQ